jgi:Peptidase M15
MCVLELVHRRRVLDGSYVKLGALLFGFAIVFVLLVPGAMQARAEGGLESQKGGLFHRKGWITPEIYRKPVRAVPAGKRYRKRTRLRRRPRSYRVASLPAARRSSSVSASRRRSVRRARTIRKRSRSRAVRSRVKHRRKTAKPKISKRVLKRQLKRDSDGIEGTQLQQKNEVQVASLGQIVPLPSAIKRKQRSVTGGSARVQWVASSRCLPARLRSAIYYVARNFGRVRVNSTCRSRRRNRRVGGARRSYHLVSRAADIRVFGNIRKAARYLRRVSGGYKHYGGGLFHIDTGPRRSW